MVPDSKSARIVAAYALRVSPKFWCPRSDSNRHSLRHYPLKIACLPIPPRGQSFEGYLPSPVGVGSLGGGGDSLGGEDEGGAAGAGCVTAVAVPSNDVGAFRCAARYASVRLVAKN